MLKLQEPQNQNEISSEFGAFNEYITYYRFDVRYSQR